MSRIETQSDEEVIRSVISGNKDAFRILVDRYKGYIFNLLLRVVRDRSIAEDLAQDVFITIYRRLHDFRGDAQFSTWIYRIAVNRGLDWKRKQERERKFIEEEKVSYEIVHNREDWPEESLSLKENRQFVHQLIDRLPEKYRIVFILFHLKDMSYQEVAKILDIPVKTVETRLYRGKKMILEWVKGGEPNGTPANRERLGLISKP